MKHSLFAIVVTPLLFLTVGCQSDGADRESIRAPAIGLESPYRSSAYSLRGQLHTHSIFSDGKQSPTQVVRAYKKAGYDFVAMTDHNRYTPDPGVKGILYIPGSEDNRDYKCLHLNRIGTKVQSEGDKSPQTIASQGRVEGAFVQINHPDWPGSYPEDPCWSDEALLEMFDYDAVEVWNQSVHPKHNHYEHRIDMLLSHGRRTNMTAVDDCHDVTNPRCMHASVYVFTGERTVPSIMRNLKSGNFYSSEGAIITSIKTEGAKVSITTPEDAYIEFIVQNGRIAKTVRGVRSAYYNARDNDVYVRIRVNRARDRRRAWSNPIYVLTK